MTDCICLNGIWDAALRAKGLPLEEALPHRHLDFTYKLQVPSYWQESVSMPQGMVIYRRRFSFEKKATHYFLKIEAVDYQGEIWLNQHYLGAMESEYLSFFKDVTHALLPGENTLLIFVSSFLPKSCERKDLVKGANLHWDCVPCLQAPNHDPLVPSSSSHRYPSPVLATGGIVGSVQLLGFSEEVILDMEALVSMGQDLKEGSLFLKLQLFNPQSVKRIPLLFTIEPVFKGHSYRFLKEVEIIPGFNLFQFHLLVENPLLWWPRGMGSQNLYQLKVFGGDRGKEEASIWTGFRKVHKDDAWGLFINGERFFAKGFNYMVSVFHKTQREEVFYMDIDSMIKAHANMVRVFAHVTSPLFYRLCDQAGLMVFQDLPFQWGYENSPSFIRKAEEITGSIVSRLNHHPSLFLWCLHSESRYMDYNKLDEVTRGVVRTLDPTRPIIKNSVLAKEGKEPPSILDFSHFTQVTEEDLDSLSVCWTGWYWEGVEDIKSYNPYFVTEFGSQSLPQSKELFEGLRSVEDLVKIGFQPLVYLQRTSSLPISMEELAHHSQAYQARFYEYHIEELRLKKYKNCNGLLAFHLVSSYPAADWSLIDHHRVPKRAYAVVKEKFQPLLPVALLKGFSSLSGEVELEIYAINDLSCEVSCRMMELVLWDQEGRLLLKMEKGGRELKKEEVKLMNSLSVPVKSLLQASSLEIILKTSQGDVKNTNHYRILEEIRSRKGG